MNLIPNREMLVRYFKGQCTKEECEVAELYLALGRDDAYVESCIAEAWSGAEWNPTELPDPQRMAHAWDQFRQRTNKARAKSRSITFRTFAYAASVVLVLLATVYVTVLKFQRTQPAVATEMVAHRGSTHAMVLPDSSTVTLFPGSRLIVEHEFGADTRTVRLTGRAFFQVQHDDKRPFQVITSNLTTQVLGTSFEVDTENDSAHSSVTLRTGRVKVLAKDKVMAVLSPGEQVMVDTLQRAVVRNVDVDAALHWMNGGLSYHQVPLSRILADVEKWYGITIVNKNSIRSQRKFTVSFESLNRQQALDLLSVITRYSYSLSGDTVTLQAMPAAP